MARHTDRMMQTRWSLLGAPVRRRPIPGVPVWEAAWSELLIIGPGGEVEASVSATTYTVPAIEPRPVMFLWNGGPGASSTPLHVEGFGPYLRREDGFDPNPDTLLPETDLVFIDPPGTGFSRIFREEARSRLLCTPSDAQAVARFIHAWLAAQQRLDAAVHFVGESYGGYRLAAALEHLEGIDVRSLTLISPLLSPGASSESPSNALAPVFQLPVLAAAHAFHARGHARRAWEEAQAFAAGTLLPHLFRTDQQAATDLLEIGAHLAALTGLPEALVLEEQLKIPSETFLRRRCKGLLLSRLDTRVTGALPSTTDPDRPAAADDPTLGLDGGNVIRSPRVAAHIRDIAGAPADREYIALSLDLNFDWDWTTEFRTPDFTVDRSSDFGVFAASRPDLRVLLIGGIFDLATPHTAALHAFRHSGIPLRQRHVLLLECGHSIDAPSRPIARAAMGGLLAEPEGDTQ